MSIDLDKLSPTEIVSELDRYIVGQQQAKKAVAIALRNRLRRRKLPKELRDEVTPKNIILIGPTGVGKTEIARRLAKLCRAPFVKVEATKYTEVGYVGRDVESMVRDLASVAVSMVKTELQEGVQEEAESRVEQRLIELLLPGLSPGQHAKPPAARPPGATPAGFAAPPQPPTGPPAAPANGTVDRFRERLRAGELEDKLVEVNVTDSSGPAIEIFSGQSFEEMDINLGSLGNLFGGRKKKKRVPIRRARAILMAEEVDRLVDKERVSELAIERVEQMGIIFLDEIDKVAAKDTRGGADVSREGVQRDILPIVEGSTVTTKWGVVDTAHVLFIAAGAFHMSKPSDLIPELQGRFPIRVELDDLGRDDFKRILTQPRNALITQYEALLATEDVTLIFTDDAVDRLSELAAEVNRSTENIGARRLHTIMELLLEDLSFNAPDLKGQTVTVTTGYVDERLVKIIEDRDLTRFIL
ncbi:MAG: ATP-dependent protease ATPase subunit HslU [Spirochaetaceae bacterium]|nr:ATP-dependent protease ATPase subunit HslU [Spirochaetaceae bacterium]MDE0447148.1 ATP-dependent protease ATPase subunit HslU [Spirochaetaceae bacterium]